ncbi:unnamed protein product [[Candida] boidinii]|uniref:Unnamed protein product n=1 Tax=Candida boidinii TaxID=5477 RepID=A0A9W6T059_CANBO|nr:hypothetical protein B5S30_g4229 [[Candida] boidinii]OWB84816.1 hypothetical protein B5S33_g3470 [[Candida] boidinii]GME69772.1 unnamed protein product [[Candida] boidinii]GMF98935.1 unnamed protein product [[Candida] boidinii]
MAKVKRGSSSSNTPSPKRTKKSESVSSKSTETKPQEIMSLDEIKNYKSKIFESARYYNYISKLIQQQTIILKKYTKQQEANEEEDDDDEEYVIARGLILIIYQIFEKLIKEEQLKAGKSSNDEKKTIVKWLRSRYTEYKDNLLNFISIGSDNSDNGNDNDNLNTIKLDSLETYMKLVKLESENMAPNKGDLFFANATFKLLINKLIKTGTNKEIIESNSTINNFIILEFYSSYYSKYWDIKFYFLQELNEILSELKENEKEKEDKLKQELIFSNVLTILKPEPLYDSKFKKIEELIKKQKYFDSNVPLKTVTNLNLIKSNFEKIILNLINFKLSIQQFKSILLILHKRIIPFLNNPTKLMDFLTDSYDLGFSTNDTSISILALNGLWELMKNYNLEYPNFFTKLYCLLTPDLLHLSYRSRFLRLLDIFMTSSHLTSNIVASFIKKFSRLSLTAPPQGIVAIIPFIYNLLKRHPSCMVLIHSIKDYKSDPDSNYSDPFDNDATDPAMTNASESSLWELETIINHYHPNVSSLAKIFTQPFNKYSYNLEDFLDWNYTKLIESEINKKFKGALAIEYENWDSLLNGNESENDNCYLKGYQW